MIQKGAWVKFAAGGIGKVKRMAKDRNWADVDCGNWSKRVPDPDKNLEVYKWGGGKGE
ncbi:hypothetical protein [Paenibacillus polymyxa]|uniref:hypothetical protein n=1 Tax=Paenibacillus polymyxa TaxID=1406 RepID=UPI00131A40DE|nr:hypothetical protein [Paenibacillus polymyxa]